MLQKRSRYARTPRFSDAGANAVESFRGLRPRAIGRATGVLEHVVVSGDRLDLLARHYYNDDRLWWRIVDANPRFLCPAEMTLAAMVGQVILIPCAEE